MAEPADTTATLLEPRVNPHLVGHEAATQTFLEAWRSDRLAHAWLVAGPRGIGKATLAYRFARFVLDGGTAADLEMAPDRPVFQRVAAGGHSDFLAIERGIGDRGKRRAEIVVADVRKANSFLSLTPGEGAWRVVVVDAAEEMNRNAANALLKLLEEPPARVLFLLVSHAPSRVLPTVRSRCRLLALRPLPAHQLEQLLSDLLPDLAGGERQALARLAEGSPGRAVALAEQGGVSLYRSLIGLVQGLPALDARPLHKLGDGLSGKDGVDRFRTLTELILWWLGRSIRAAAHGDSQKIEEIVPGEAAAVRLLDGAPLDQWVDVWENLGRSFAQADGLNLDPKQVLIGAFTTLQQAARP
jgi:DNA polymerase-3 subunit delta'